VLSEHSIRLWLNLYLRWCLPPQSHICHYYTSITPYLNYTSPQSHSTSIDQSTITFTHTNLHLLITSLKPSTIASPPNTPLHKKQNYPNTTTPQQLTNHGLPNLGMETLHQDNPPLRLPSHRPDQPSKLRGRQSRPRHRWRQRYRQVHRSRFQQSWSQSRHHHWAPRECPPRSCSRAGEER
jgi:hypothetical protein